MVTQQSAEISQGGGAVRAEPLPGGRWDGDVKHVLEREVMTSKRGYWRVREGADIPIVAERVRYIDAPLLP